MSHWTEDLLEAVRMIIAQPYGCTLCDSGRPLNPAKGHQPDCGFEAARIAVARVEDARRGGKQAPQAIPGCPHSDTGSHTFLTSADNAKCEVCNFPRWPTRTGGLVPLGRLDLTTMTIKQTAAEKATTDEIHHSAIVSEYLNEVIDRSFDFLSSAPSGVNEVKTLVRGSIVVFAAWYRKRLAAEANEDAH